MMKDEIKSLLDLQKLDTQIADIQATVKEVPDKILSLNTKIKDDEAKIDNLDSKIEDLNKEISSFQNQTMDINEKIKTLEDKLFSISSSKEFEALQKETGDLKRKKIEVEDSELKIMEQVESSTKDLELLQSRFDEELSPLKDEIKELESVLQKSEILKVYTRLLTYSPPVVAEAKGEVCGHCYMKIPPQTYIKVLQENEIILCPCSKKILTPEIS